MSEAIIQQAKAEFLAAVKGIPGHHVIAAMNIATPGVEWRHCSKTLMAESYARTRARKRFSLSLQGNEGMVNLNLELLRRAALERMHGHPQWHTFYCARGQE